MKDVPEGGSLVSTIEKAPTGLVGIMGVRVLDADGDVVVPRTTLGIAEKPAGSGHYSATLGPLLLPVGQYEVMWDSDVLGVATPVNSASEEFRVVTAASVDITPIPGNAITWQPICGLWVAPELVKAQVAGATDEQALQAAQIASEVLYELSGEVFYGVCHTTERFEGVVCLGHSGRRWDYGGRSWALRLIEPVVEVIAVTWNGNALDVATDVELYPDGLRRTGGWGWSGIVDVEYEYGSGPPATGVAAALAFATELLKAMASGSGQCRLPVGITQITRAGITMQAKGKPGENASKDKLGIPATDLFLATWGGSASIVWSPDTERNARRIA